MLVDIKPRLTKPPFGSVQIDWGHPLAQGLRFYTFFNEGGGPPLRLHPPARPTVFSGITWQLNQRGLELKGSATADLRYTVSSYEQPVRPFTWIFGIRLTTTSNLVIAEMNGNQMSLQSGQQVGKPSLTANAGSVFPSDTSILDGVPHTVAVVMASGADKWFQDGKDLTSGSSNEPNYGGVTTFNTFSRNGSFAYTDSLFFLGIINRAWSQNNALWLQEEPYAFLQPVPSPRYWSIPPAVAVTGGTHVLYLRRAA